MQLPPPTTSLSVVGVRGPFNGASEISIGDYKYNELIAKRHGVKLRVSNVQFDINYPYYSMPVGFLGNQLKSYGGSFQYVVEYIAEGYVLNIPDIILIVSIDLLTCTTSPIRFTFVFPNRVTE